MVFLVWHVWLDLRKRLVLKVGRYGIRVLAAVAKKANVGQAEVVVSTNSIDSQNPYLLPSKGEEDHGGNLESDLAATGELKRKVDDGVVGKVEESSDGQDQRYNNVDEDADAAIETVVLSDHQVDEAESVPRNREGKLGGH